MEPLLGPRVLAVTEGVGESVLLRVEKEYPFEAP
jgi:hypothetical protein